MQQELTAIFSGSVQGVFFRSTIKKHAEKLFLKGYAKNLFNGSVEVKAVGDRKILEKFIVEIKKDPGLSRIDDVKVV